VTQEEYIRLKNLLNTVVEQQATFSENQAKADARMSRHEEAIAALLTLAEVHEHERSEGDKRVDAKFEEVATRFAETDDRINALVNVVERYISKN
jgi:hypothetical protein